MAIFQDQLGRKIELKDIPKRIISLVPSQTELLYDLGLEEEVIGITKFCVHPESWFRNKTRIGGTKKLDLKKIADLHPDLIIANKEENMRDQVEVLAEDFPVWTSDINTLEDALQMIEAIGAITGKEKIAEQIFSDIQNAFSQLNITTPPLSAAYLIWRNPYMTVGNDNFISGMMHRAGFANAFSHLTRYPEITVEDIRNAGCQVVMLSSEPYPFAAKHVKELREKLPDTKIILVDGEMFSWYGSRLRLAPEYFKKVRNEILSLSHAAGNR